MDMSPVPLSFHHFYSLPLVLNSWCFTEALHTHPKRSVMHPTQMHHFWTQINRIKPLGYPWVCTAPSETPKMPSIHTALHQGSFQIPTTLEPLLTTQCAGQLPIKWQLGYLLIISSQYQYGKKTPQLLISSSLGQHKHLKLVPWCTMCKNHRSRICYKTSTMSLTYNTSCLFPKYLHKLDQKLHIAWESRRKIFSFTTH